MRTYPVNLIELARRRAVVIGGGAVAWRKVQGLLAAGSSVTVISPDLVPGLAELNAAGAIAVTPRCYQDGDLTGAWLVVAATDDASVNHAVSAEAMRRGCLVNVVDDPDHSNFIVPAVLRRGEIAVTICTGGASPALARRLRERLDELIPPEYGDFAALLAELRPELLARFDAGQPRLDAALRLVDSDVLQVLHEQGMAAARAHARAVLTGEITFPAPAAESHTAPAAPRTQAHPCTTDADADAGLARGTVYLVGAGPGDPGLITVRGLACLRAADVVVYDRLVPPALLREAPAARRIDVGKQPDRHPVPQEEINRILVDEARRGAIVVRLKGGDPFVFGRGGEEAEALAGAGLPFEVVPGVTSAIAAAAYAGIPITHRDAASSFAVFTGHRRGDCATPAQADPGATAASADTLVYLMGMGNLPAIVDDLRAGGRPASTPAAVVARGAWPQQRTVTGTLDDIVGTVAAAGIVPPAALIVGEVVRLRDRLRWYDRPEQRPLLGLRVLNTRPEHDAVGLTRKLAGLGAEVIALPATRIAAPRDPDALDQVIHRLCRAPVAARPWDWIVFTSANAVRAFLNRLFSLAPDGGGAGGRAAGRCYDARCLAGVRIASIGAATSAALSAYGLTPDLVPDHATGSHLAVALPDIAGRRLLLPRSDQAPPDLPRALAARGASVTEVIAYAVTPAEPDPAVLDEVAGEGVDVALFCSPSALRGTAAMVGDRPLAAVLGRAAIACIGPTTAAAAQEMGLRPDIVGDIVGDTTGEAAEALVNALLRWRAAQEQPGTAATR